MDDLSLQFQHGSTASNPRLPFTPDLLTQTVRNAISRITVRHPCEFTPQGRDAAAQGGCAAQAAIKESIKREHTYNMFLRQRGRAHLLSILANVGTEPAAFERITSGIISTSGTGGRGHSRGGDSSGGGGGGGSDGNGADVGGRSGDDGGNGCGSGSGRGTITPHVDSPLQGSADEASGPAAGGHPESSGGANSGTEPPGSFDSGTPMAVDGAPGWGQPQQQQGQQQQQEHGGQQVPGNIQAGAQQPSTGGGAAAEAWAPSCDFDNYDGGGADWLAEHEHIPGDSVVDWQQAYTAGHQQQNLTAETAPLPVQQQQLQEAEMQRMMWAYQQEQLLLWQQQQQQMQVDQQQHIDTQAAASAEGDQQPIAARLRRQPHAQQRDIIDWGSDDTDSDEDFVDDDYNEGEDELQDAEDWTFGTGGRRSRPASGSKPRGRASKRAKQQPTQPPPPLQQQQGQQGEEPQLGNAMLVAAMHMAQQPPQQRRRGRPPKHYVPGSADDPYLREGANHKGITFQHDKGKWRASLSLKGRNKKHIGYFATPTEAARAYDRAALQHGLLNPTVEQGTFDVRSLNFPITDYPDVLSMLPKGVLELLLHQHLVNQNVASLAAVMAQDREGSAVSAFASAAVQSVACSTFGLLQEMVGADVLAGGAATGMPA